MNNIIKTKNINTLVGSAMPLNEFLDFAISVSATLVEIHKKNQIYGAICPENIIWQPKNLKAELADSADSDEKPLFSAAHLPYISPEQTGRMNRRVDYRTDLYSLGVVLYEILVGEPPFVGDDPLEMIHTHIASMPLMPRARRAEVPEQISTIIMRLLQKNADDRYQSAYGLQHDLERCARQWKQNGSIKRFGLGKSDLTGIFRIPQKLYGRENEVKTLLDSFERISTGGTELFMVAGYSGVGKSALVHEVQKPMTAKRGFFIEGKFDQYQRNIPYFAWQQAFSALLNHLLMESDDRLADWKTRILEAVGPNGKVLTELIRNLELVIGLQSDVPVLGGAEAQNRFNAVFQNFVKAVADKEHPLVIFLDDLHWIDSASLKLLHVLVTDPDISHVQYIGAYRDNEVDAAHPLIVFLESLKDDRAVMKQITLQNLLEEDVNALIADTLQSSLVDTHSLAELIYSKTTGNAFFTHQILRTLNDENLLTFDATAGHWHWDMEALRALDIAENVVELLSTSMRKLPVETQEVLKLASYIGNLFDPDILSLIARKKREYVEGDLKVAVQEGVIFPLNGQYKFAHDRIQQAAYSLIPEEVKKETHLEIGRLLLEKIPEDERKERIFDIVNQLNIGAELLSTTAEQIQLAELNLAAGQKAKAGAAFADAKKYTEMGLDLLGTDPWQDHYDLTLSLQNENGELAALTGQFDQVSTTANLIHANAKNVLDQVRIYMTQIEAETAQYNPAEALEIGLDVLGELGFDIPAQPAAEDRQRLHGKFIGLLTSGPMERLAQIPAMSDQKAFGASSLFASIMSTSYIIKPPLFPIISYNGAILTLEYGLDVWTPFFFGGVTLVNFASIDGESPVNEALSLIRFYKQLVGVIREMLDNPVTARSRSKGLMMLAFTVPWVESIEQSVEFAQATFSSGYETGDWLYSSYGAIFFSVLGFDAGMNLDEYEIQLSAYISNANRMGQITPAEEASIFLQTALNFKEISPEPHKLIGTFFHEDEWLPGAISTNDMAGRHYFYVAKLILGYHFDLDEKLDEYAGNAEDFLAGGQGMYSNTLFHFYFALARLRLVSGSNSKKHLEIMNMVDKNLRWMAIWSRSVPSTFQHKHDLMAAEKARVTGDIESALSNYEQAISGAREHGFIHEEALANELYARFWAERDNDRFAGPLMREAHSLYLKWGACGKADHLAKRYPIWLITQSIDDQGLGDLDLRTVLKASRAISGEIALDKLLAKMMHIIIENAGAQNGFLILARGDEWIIEAIADVNKSKVQVLQSISIETNNTVSTGIIHYVAHTQETIVLADAANEGDFTSDDTIQHRQSRSVLCTPLINQGRISAILYLENNLTTGVFSTERVELLKLLSSEMAMALDNAQVYRNLEQSEERLRSITENSSDTITLVGPDLKIQFINKTDPDFKKEDIIGKSINNFTPKGLQKFVTKKYQSVFKTGKPTNYQTEYIAAVGERHSYDVRLSPITKEGKVTSIVSTANDITERKKADVQNRKFNKIIETTSQSVIITNIKGTVLYVNPSYYAFSGFVEDEVIGKSMYRFAHKKGAIKLAKEVVPALIKKGHWQGDMTIVKKDKQIVPVDLICSLLYDEKNKPEFFVALFSDITNRMRAEEALKKSEARLVEAQRTAHLGEWEWDIVKNEVHWSAELCRIFVIDPDEIKPSKDTFIERVHPDDRRYLEERISAVLSNKEPFSVDHRIILQSGTIRFLHSEARVECDAENKPVRLFGIAQDITERKQAEDALSESENRFRATFEQAAVGVAHVAPDGRFLQINRKFCEITGYSMDEMLARTFQDITYPDDLEKDLEHVGRLLRGVVNDYSMEKRYIRKDGSIVWVNLTVSLLRSESGDPGFFVSVVEDITMRKAAEKTILKYQRRLKDLANQLILSEEKQRRQIATDLHDHVGQILASSRLQIAAINKSMDKEDILKKLKNISGGLNDTIKATRDAIFELSPPQLNEIGLAAALSDWMHKELETKQGIKCELSGDAKKYPVNNVIRYLIFRCTCELLVNVVKHARASKVTVYLQKKNDNISISVHDNGVGFNYNPELLKMKYSGFGLLSIHERIENIGGTLQIETAPGKGTKVVLKVPVNN